MLSPGDRLGPYEVVSPLGAGGMGEVYRARDTKLDRDVALKVLHSGSLADEAARRRFRREALALSRLAHPHIAAVYDFDTTEDGTNFLVMELVPGLSLDARLKRGPLPEKEVVRLGAQLARALGAAHEHRVLHRDLKPANLKLTQDGLLKVLDFGLARFTTVPGDAITATDTASGIVAGTPPYMSPELLLGREVDERSDVYAAGVVLYEMATGRRPFGEASGPQLVAKILHEPAPTPREVNPAVSPQLEQVILKASDRDKGLRHQTAKDLLVDLERLAAGMATASASPATHAATPSRRVTPAAIAALAGFTVITALAAWILLRPAPTSPVPPTRFAIAPAPGLPFNVSGLNRDLALSPDGRSLVYRAGGTNTAGSPLMVRAIDRLDAQPVANVSNAYAPFFSPDSRWIGFFENTELKKVPIAGGPAITLCRFSGRPLGASWGDDNTITFATDAPSTGLGRVSANGGEPTIVTKADPAHHEGSHSFPSVLPLGRGVLFTTATVSEADRSVAVLDLKTGQRKTLIRGGGDAQYVETGHLIFAAAGALRAVRFDPVRLEVLGDPVTVVDRVMMKPSGAANYAISLAGTLVYISTGVSEMTGPRELLWVDRKGHEEPTGAPLRAYGTPRLSPDGTRVAAEIYDQNTDIWIWDFARGTLRRLTFDPAGDGMAVWTPDSRTLIFQSGRSGIPSVFRQAADGTATVDRLSTSDTPQWSTSITPDGTWLSGFELQPRSPPSVFFLPLTRAGARPASSQAPGLSQSPVEALTETRFRGDMADFSPNGRYLAYQSGESGRAEIYVRPFPRVNNGRWQVSTAGGTRPAWARSGRELFYLDASNALTAVPVGISGPTISIGDPAKLFATGYAEPNPSRHYDVSTDGQRFLMLKASAAGSPNAAPISMVVVEHWFDELKQRVNGK